MDETEFQDDRPLPSHKRRIPYSPQILAAVPVRIFRSERHAAILLDKVQTAGAIQYKFLLTVFEKDPEDPSLIVSSELFAGGPETMIGVFNEGGHETFARMTEDWAEKDRFCREAMGIVRNRLGLDLREVDSKRPWWKFW